MDRRTIAIIFPCTALTDWFLGAFSIFRKATVSFVMSARPSVCPHGTTRLSLDEFSLNVIFGYFSKKTFDKIQVSLRSENNKGYFTRRPLDIFGHFSFNSFKMRNVSDKICRGNQNTHFVFNNFFFFFENRAIYEILCKIRYSQRDHR